MLTVLLVSLSSALLSGMMASFVFLALALYLLLGAVGQHPNLAQFLFCFLICTAPICSAALLGQLLQRFCFEGRQLNLISTLAMVLCLLLSLNSDHLALYLSTLFGLSKGLAAPKLISSLIAVGSTVVFCAGVSAACLMLCVLSVEAPLAWWTRAHLFEQLGRSLRPLLLIIACSLASYLLVGLYAAEFAADRLFAN